MSSLCRVNMSTMVYGGPPQISFFAYYMSPPPADQFLCILYAWPPPCQFLRIPYAPPPVSFFTYHIGPLDQFLRILYGAPLTNVSFFNFYALNALWGHNFEFPEGGWQEPSFAPPPDTDTDTDNSLFRHN